MSTNATPAHSAPDSDRQSALLDWLSKIAAPQLQLSSLRPASTDASFRRYYRLEAADGLSYIVMDAPPPMENVASFVKVAALFRSCHLTVPAVLAQDLELGFLLLSDLGQKTYAQVLTHDNAHQLYQDAIDSLILLQTQSQPEVLPEYDRAFVLRELNIFSEWYLGKHLGVSLSEAQQQTLNKVFEHLAASALAQPQVFMHRDYHSRNLMWQGQGTPGNPGVLDFQDAVYGPITYDLVSLLRDAYVQWDEEMVLDWAIRYWEKAKRAGLPVATDIDSFYRDFEWMGLQRHLKILGIFARLSHRDGKDNYLADMPLVLEYVRKTAHRYKELVPLLRLLDQLEQKAPQVGYTF
ncbi:MAG: phosphotransferase [Burkholderiales bacterium]|nr:phosphotransferase [Burkholderiales bacterium]